MKAILDTNVLVSGIFFKGPPHDILVEWKKGKFKLVVSHEILDEYRRIVDDLSDKFPNIDITEIMEKIALNCEVTFSIVLRESICDDPDDDKFFAAAIASKSKIIISGDKHLLNKSGYSGIMVVKPAEFIRINLKK
jgi:putative PIN family toxin of toxin-antitoxin system